MKLDIALYVLRKMIRDLVVIVFCLWVYVQGALLLSELYRPYVNNPECVAFITPLVILAVGILFFIMYCDEEARRR